MKTISIILTVLTSFTLQAKADNSIDAQLNAAQDFVVVGTPTYQGYRFLAHAADESSGKIESRAIKVCHLMGLGSPVAYSAPFVAQTEEDAEIGKTSNLWSGDSENISLSTYYNGYWSSRDGNLLGKTSYISNLACKKKVN